MNVDSRGSGPDLVLVHGWGLGSSAWGPLPDLLADHFRVHVIDLPGYGANHAVACPPTMEDLAAMLLDQLPPAHWVGWSLGGLVALAAGAQAPRRLNGIALIACSRRFVDPDERVGIGPAVFDAFGDLVDADPAAALTRFCGLVATGEGKPRQALAVLRRRLGSTTLPGRQVLLTGLEWLAESDLPLPADIPVHWQAGVEDHLVPIAAIPPGAWRVPKAGHAPFCGREAETAAWLVERLERSPAQAATA